MVLFFASNEPCYKKYSNTSVSLLTKRCCCIFYNTANAAKVSSSAANFRHSSLLSQPALPAFITPHYPLTDFIIAYCPSLHSSATNFHHASSPNLLSPFRLQQYLILLRRHGLIEIVALHILSTLILNEFYLFIRFHAL